jgi:hypothetical protein
LPLAIFRPVQVCRQGDAVAVLETDLLVVDLVALGESLVPFITEWHLRLREGLTRGNRPNAPCGEAGAGHLQHLAASGIGRILNSEGVANFIMLIHGRFSD